MRVSYGRNNCFLLRMNSRPPGNGKEQLPDPWSQFLSTRLPVSYASKETVTPESSPNVERVLSASWERTSNEDTSSLGFHPLSPQIEDNPVVITTNCSTISFYLYLALSQFFFRLRILPKMTLKITITHKIYYTGLVCQRRMLNKLNF